MHTEAETNEANNLSMQTLWLQHSQQAGKVAACNTTYPKRKTTHVYQMSICYRAQAAHELPH